MSAYVLIKYFHITCALMSLLGFLLRGVWMLTGSALLQERTTRILPHVIDSLLLGSAIVLVILSRQYPFVTGWITLKLGLLLLYIGLGTFALKRGKTRRSRSLFLGGAIITIGLIFWTALTKPVLPF